MTTCSRPASLAGLAILLVLASLAVRAPADETALKPRTDAARARDSLAARQVMEVTIPRVMAPAAPAAPPAAKPGNEEHPCPPSREYAITEVTIGCEQRSRYTGYICIRCKITPSEGRLTSCTGRYMLLIRHGL
jgi:hypothetical protein